MVQLTMSDGGYLLAWKEVQQLNNQTYKGKSCNGLLINWNITIPLNSHAYIYTDIVINLIHLH